MPESLPKKRFSPGLLWCAVPVLIAIELVFQWRIPRQVPTEAEWRRASAFVREQKRPGDLIVIAPSWATQGRMALGDLLSMADFGAFDTDGYARVIEVSLNGAIADETRGLVKVDSASFGHISVNRYQNRGWRSLSYNFVGNAQRARIGEKGRVGARLVIDHWFHPRLAVPISLGPKPTRVVYQDVPLSGTLRVYTVIGYREGRFDRGEPVRFSVYVNDRRVIDRSVANFSPIEPTDVALSGGGKGTVAFEASAKGNLKREFSFAAVILGRQGGAR